MKKRLSETLRRNKKPLLWGISMAAIVVLFLGGSFLSLVHNKKEKYKLTQTIKQLDKDYVRLKELKEKLENEDPELFEQIARTEYNLVKPGEAEFRFTQKQKGKL